MSSARKKRVLINTNYSKMFTGFGKNAKNLLSYLYSTGKYELFEYCAGMQWSTPELKLQPWRANGTLPDTQHEINEINKDAVRARNASYGEYNMERAVQDFKPDVTLHIEDSWGVTFNSSKNFWGKIPSVYWVTQDSLPLINPDDAKKTPHYWCWSSFATNELHRLGSTNAKTQYPLVDLTNFKILPDSKKSEIRKRFNIPEQVFIITQVARNQLRKLFPAQVEAYAMFKRQNPQIPSILLFVTNFTEGWDIPRLAQQYGVPPQEIWCAYVSHETGDYVLAPYQGNDQSCPWTKKEKRMHTVSVVKGVTEEALNEIYNISDVLSHPATSGACELPLVEAAAAGKIILTPDYSYGEDVIKFNKGAIAMEWAKYPEIGTQFIKASPQPFGIAKLFKKVYDMPKKRRDELGLLSRQWAQENYDMAVNGKKIDEFLDSIPFADWDKISLSTPLKDDKFPMPADTLSDADFITALYIGVLKSTPETVDKKGHSDWMASLKAGQPRKAIYDYFIQVARQDNAKVVAPQDVWSLVDKTTGRKRILLVIKESLGDCLMITQLFESLHEQYPDHDLYVGVDPKFAEVFVGNKHIFEILDYQPFMEQEMTCSGAGQTEALFDVYLHPAVLSQRHLGYLFSETAALTPYLSL